METVITKSAVQCNYWKSSQLQSSWLLQEGNSLSHCRKKIIAGILLLLSPPLRTEGGFTCQLSWVSYSMTKGRRPCRCKQPSVATRSWTCGSLRPLQPRDSLSLLTTVRSLSWPVWQQKDKLCCGEYQWHQVLLRDMEPAKRGPRRRSWLCAPRTEGCCRGRLVVTR